MFVGEWNEREDNDATAATCRRRAGGGKGRTGGASRRISSRRVAPSALIGRVHVSPVCRGFFFF